MVGFEPEPVVLGVATDHGTLGYVLLWVGPVLVEVWRGKASLGCVARKDLLGLLRRDYPNLLLSAPPEPGRGMERRAAFIRTGTGTVQLSLPDVTTWTLTGEQLEVLGTALGLVTVAAGT